MQEDSVRSRGIASAENCGEDAEKLVVPVTLPGGNLGMVILEESPNLAQCHEVVYLDVRKRTYGYSRTVVKLVIKIESGFRPLRFGHVPDRFAIDQQLQIVHP